MGYNLLKDLLPLLEQFEQEAGEGTPAQFGSWLSRQTSGPETGESPGEAALEGLAGYYLGILCKHSSHYIKKAFRDLRLNGMEEYGFLQELELEGRLSKSALIQACYSSTPSGMEVIKRLLRKELILETSSETDKRVKILEISPLGRKELKAARKDTERMARLLTGGLSLEQKDQLVGLLGQLMRFHEKIFLASTEEMDLNDLETSFLTDQAGQ
jgi:DNA-binding MarR family transcriptional regulator